ncbi:MAG: phosphoribosylaminoimidazolesuccinocarboxamide synthase, partial [Candidatus Hecatellaceae archaeon]
MSMEKLGEGKTKIVYSLPQPDQVLLKFKDDITALDGAKKDKVPGKGRVNARVSAFLFRLLEENGIPTHFISFEPPASLRVRKLKMIPVEVVCRNIATGRLVKTYPFYKQGERL